MGQPLMNVQNSIAVTSSRLAKSLEEFDFRHAKIEWNRKLNLPETNFQGRKSVR